MLGLHIFKAERMYGGRCGVVISRPSPGHLICCGKPEDSLAHAGAPGTFDRYANFYAAMDVVRNARLSRGIKDLVENPEGCDLARRVINRLREAAMAEIPYGATTPNRTWDGRWA